MIDEMPTDNSIFGVDYSSLGGVTATGDIELVEELDNAKQSIRNWILTDKGFYPSVDTEYGSEIRETLGDDFEDTTVDALIVYVQNALYSNPRVNIIKRIEPYVTIDKQLQLVIEVELVNGTEETFNVEVNE